MKDSLKYPGFWQKKRNELRIDDDPQSDWLQMQALLDQQMPSANTNIGSGGSTISSGLSLWAKLGIALLAAAVIYSAYYFLYNGKRKYPGSGKFKKENTLRSVANVSNTPGGVDSSAAHTNASNTKQTLTTQNKSKDADLITNRGRVDGKPAESNNSQHSTARLNAATALSLNGVPGKIQSASNSRFANGASSSSSHNSKRNGLVANADGGQSIGSQTNNHSAVNYSSTQNSVNEPAGDKRTYNINHNKKDNKVAVLSSNCKNARLSGYSNDDENEIIKDDKGGKRNGGGRLLSSTYGYSQSVNPRDGSSKDNYNKQSSLSQQKSTGTNANDKNAGNNGRSGYTDLVAKNHGFELTQDNIKIIAGRPLNNRNGWQIIKPGKFSSTVNSKAKNAHTKTSSLNWGILIGANTSGSFTPKSENSNFYGSLPADLYFGPFVTYNFNNKWAVSSQLRLLSPQTIITRYTHPNASKVDSGQLLSVTASRKIYSVSIPVYAVYKITPNVGFKIGPVINIPTKQINAGSTLQPNSIRTDTAYYAKLRGQLDSTSYQQKLNFGLSGGVSIRVKRFIFEATYLKSLSGYKVSSGLGTYKSNNGTFQLSVGFQFK